jgi:hypothetical protein
MTVDERRVPLALLGVTLLWCLALALLGAHDGPLYLVPALLLSAPLAIRRYPGEVALRALAAARPRARRRSERRPASPPRPDFSLIVRGSLLLARSLAGRPPPRLTAIA